MFSFLFTSNIHTVVFFLPLLFMQDKTVSTSLLLLVIKKTREHDIMNGSSLSGIILKFIRGSITGVEDTVSKITGSWSHSLVPLFPFPSDLSSLLVPLSPLDDICIQVFLIHKRKPFFLLVHLPISYLSLSFLSQNFWKKNLHSLMKLPYLLFAQALPQSSFYPSTFLKLRQGLPMTYLSHTLSSEMWTLNPVFFSFYFF